MPEIDFLPQWYPQICRRRRVVALQAWIAVALAAGLGLWMFLAQRNVASAESTLHTLNSQLSQTGEELNRLEDLLQLQRQWHHQDQIISRLGLHVESTRVLSLLSAVMPAEMALMELTIQVEESSRGPVSLGQVRAAVEREQAVERRMRVVLLGVAPTGVDLARFLTRLSEMPFLKQVTMKHLRDRTEGLHVMREFELTFWLELTE